VTRNTHLPTSVHSSRRGRSKKNRRRDSLDGGTSLHWQGVEKTRGGALAVEARAPDGVDRSISRCRFTGFALALKWHPKWPSSLHGTPFQRVVCSIMAQPDFVARSLQGAGWRSTINIRRTLVFPKSRRSFRTGPDFCARQCDLMPARTKFARNTYHPPSSPTTPPPPTTFPQPIDPPPTQTKTHQKPTSHIELKQNTSTYTTHRKSQPKNTNPNKQHKKLKKPPPFCHFLSFPLSFFPPLPSSFFFPPSYFFLPPPPPNDLEA